MKPLIKQLLRENLLKENGNKIICYHRSNSLEHMRNSDFSLEFTSDLALFGPAIYFSESPNIDSKFGKYICKFEISLDEPVLDMNKTIKGSEQQSLVDLFNKLSGENFETDIDDTLYPNVQIGDIFQEISEQYNWDNNVYYKDLITSLGYKSFKYFQNYYTDFVNQKGDYGTSYGIYNPNNIKFIDGPF